MGALDRLPACATTGVGSLPFTDPAEAAADAVAAYDLHFCPQLPRVEGDMIAEWLGADPRRCGWSPERDHEWPRAWRAWIERLALEPPEHGLVKLQVTGPLTLTPFSRTASCFLADAVPKTSAPTIFAIWVAAIPTPPAAAWTRRRSPRAEKGTRSREATWARAADLVVRKDPRNRESGTLLCADPPRAPFQSLRAGDSWT